MTLGCGEARLDRVPSAQIDGIAGENPAPAVVAAHVHALTGAGLRHRRPGGARASADVRMENRSARVIVMPSSADWLPLMVVDRSRISVQGSTRRPMPHGKRRKLPNKFNELGKFRPCRARRPLQNHSCPFKRGPPERWPSGLRRTLGKRVCGKPYRGFESHSLRHAAISKIADLLKLKGFPDRRRYATLSSE